MILRKLLNRPKSAQSSSHSKGRLFPRRTAGVLVDEDTALTYSAVYLSVKIISESLAALPINIRERATNSEDTKIARQHPTSHLVRRPNPEMTGFNFWRTIIGHAALRGNGYAYIERDRSNRPSALWLLTPDRVTKGRDKETDQIVYMVNNGTAPPSYYSDDSIFHLPGMGFDGLTGYSVVTLAARSIGVGMAAEQFSASFYENGAQLGTVIEVPAEVELDEDGATLLIDSFDKKHKGVKHHHRTALIDKGMKVSSIGIPQKDAQFIESQKFSVTTVARWFNLPPHKLKDLELTTVGNVEEQNIGFLQDSLIPWIINIEQTIDWKLLGRNNNKHFTKMNVNALMRGNSEQRAAYYRERLQSGSMSINEVKRLEDENGIGPDGDKYFMQSAMTTVERIVNPPEPPAPVIPALPPSEERATDGQDEGEKGGAVENLERFRPLIKNAINKPFMRISDRINQAKELTTPAALDTWLMGHLDNRREYIADSVGEVFTAVTNRPASDADAFVDTLISTCRNHFMMSLEPDAPSPVDSLAGDFLAFCATITETNTGDA